MSHTFEGDTCRIHYNSDYSGTAILYDMAGCSIQVNCQDLLQFAAEYVRQEKISKLETANWQKILTDVKRI